jgi:hypothetical protein
MTTGKGTNVVFKQNYDGRLDSVTTDGRITKIHYDSARKTAKVTGVSDEGGKFVSIETLIANSKRKKGAAPAMSIAEAKLYMQRALEKSTCSNAGYVKSVGFKKVDAEDIPPELFTQEYWEEIIVSVAPYDPVCNETDCLEFTDSWEDSMEAMCGLQTLMWWWAQLQAL